MPRYMRNARDGNHASIVSALEEAGCRVADLSDAGGGIADIFCIHPITGRWTFMEIKTKRGRMRKAQEEFRAKFRCAVVRTPTAALEAMGIEVAT